MSTDPNDLGQGPGDGGSGDPGTPTPNELAAALADNERLKQENAKLREDKREERARALGAEHGLGPTQVDLLKLVPADQMEEKAKALVAERGPKGAPPEPPPDGGAPPADPTLTDFDRQPPGEPPADPSLSWQDELQKELEQANTLEEIADIQRKYRDRQRSGQLG